MDYNEAINVVKSYYVTQYDLLKNNLCQDAIITLAELCKSNNQKQLSNDYIKKISTFEPYRQCGYLTNPFIQHLIDSYTSKIVGQTPQLTNFTQTIQVKQNDTKPVDHVLQSKSEPLQEDEEALLYDIFS